MININNSFEISRRVFTYKSPVRCLIEASDKILVTGHSGFLMLFDFVNEYKLLEKCKVDFNPVSFSFDTEIGLLVTGTDEASFELAAISEHKKYKPIAKITIDHIVGKDLPIITCSLCVKSSALLVGTPYGLYTYELANWNSNYKLTVLPNEFVVDILDIDNMVAATSFWSSTAY